MRRRIAPDLAHRAQQVSNYAIKPTRRGYALWRFKDWTRKNRGWSILARYPTHEAAEQDLLERLDLEPVKPKPVMVMASITYVHELGDGFDYGGWI